MLAAERLGVRLADSVIVGDSVWELLACRGKALGIGLLSEGYSSLDLEHAGAYRVHNDPADLLTHIEELSMPADQRSFSTRC